MNLYPDDNYHAARAAEWVASEEADAAWLASTEAAKAVRGVARAHRTRDGDVVGPERAEHANLLRDIFGNPFATPRPIQAAWLRWNDGTVLRIATGIYEERAFERLPVLGDALLDAGCDDEDLIAHCRSTGPHIRGCIAVDLILGKS